MCSAFYAADFEIGQIVFKHFQYTPNPTRPKIYEQFHDHIRPDPWQHGNQSILYRVSELI